MWKNILRSVCHTLIPYLMHCIPLYVVTTVKEYSTFSVPYFDPLFGHCLQLQDTVNRLSETVESLKSALGIKIQIEEKQV